MLTIACFCIAAAAVSGLAVLYYRSKWVDERRQAQAMAEKLTFYSARCEQLSTENFGLQSALARWSSGDEREGYRHRLAPPIQQHTRRPS